MASGVAYAALCVTAVKILPGASSGGGSSSPKQTTGGVLDWTGGTEIVAVVGAILIGVALAQGYKGVSRKFLDNSKTEEMSREGKRDQTRAARTRRVPRIVTKRESHTVHMPSWRTAATGTPASLSLAA